MYNRRVSNKKKKKKRIDTPNNNNKINYKVKIERLIYRKCEKCGNIAILYKIKIIKNAERRSFFKFHRAVEHLVVDGELHLQQ